MRKLFLCMALCASLFCAGSVQAQNLITNGDFATDLSGWGNTANGSTTITHDAGVGNGAGSALLHRNDSTASDNGNYLYQIVDVIPGQDYLLSAEWQGDLLNGGTGRNWAEVYVNFGADVPSLDPTSNPGVIDYKVATDGGPNDPMPSTWANILMAPNGGPVDGVYTASDEYMLVAFNLGGRDVTRNNTQPGYYWVDNVSLTRVVPEPAGLALLALSLGAVTLRRRVA